MSESDSVGQQVQVQLQLARNALRRQYLLAPGSVQARRGPSPAASARYRQLLLDQPSMHHRVYFFSPKNIELI